MNDNLSTKATVCDDNIYCYICQEECINAEYLCPNNHGYCLECINSHYEVLLFGGKEITNKCTICKEPFYQNKLEAILNDDVLLLLFKNNVFKELKLPDEYEIRTCSLCPPKKEFTFVINKNDFIQYVKCLGDACGKTSCLYCYGEAKLKDHKICQTYYLISEYLLQAMSKSKTGLCTSCKTNNINDIEYLKGSGCTHMKCKKCNSPICYVCGKNENELDYNILKSKIFGHNDDWATNIQRCPMYLREFNAVDKTWPKDDTSAVMKLYNYKLQSFVCKIIGKFGHISVNCAYNLFKDNKLQMLSQDFIDDYAKFKKLSYIENRIVGCFKI